MEEKKKSAIVIIVVIAIVCIVAIIGTLIENRENKKRNANINNTNTTNSIDTYKTDIEKIKNEFNNSDVELNNRSESEYSISGHFDTLEKAMGDMMYSLEKNEKISKNWMSYASSFYSESEYSRYNHITFECDISDISTADEMKSYIKDSSQIIWESLNIIYGSEKINSDTNAYFNKLNYTFEYKYKYIDKYGNEKPTQHEMNFEITKNAYNKINFETFPNILAVDYTKIFDLGKVKSKVGENGIKIDFDNLLVK